MDRFLVLFAREPARQARGKGLGSPEAAELFCEFARGWLEASRHAGARLVFATPPEDVAGWRRVLCNGPDPIWIAQRGNTLGARLEDAARRAALLGGHAVIVGGDVAPSACALTQAFEALEAGADAVISPAPDGGVSLLALCPSDLDLLLGIRERRRTVLRDLLQALAGRGRRARLLPPAADVDGKGSLRVLLREDGVAVLLIALARGALVPARIFREQLRSGPSLGVFHGPPLLRGPPLLA